MKGIIRKVEYEGDWPTFFELAKVTIKEGGSFLYNIKDQRGLIIEPDGTEKIAVLIPSLRPIITSPTKQ